MRRAAVAVCAALAVSAAPAYGASVQVTGLETNAAATPLGIDDATPELRWRLESADRGVKPTSYRVVVATTAAKAAAGDGDVWDSGTVASSALSTDYAGPALKSRTRYFWSVKAAGSDWAPATWFETAYLTPAEWKGTWISGPARTPAHLTNAEASADDACCLQGNTTLTQAAAAGDKVLRIASNVGFAPGKTITVGDESVTLEAVGTGAGSTTTAAPVAAGDTNVKVVSVNNFAPGAQLTIGSQTVTVTEVGTAAGNATTLFAPVAAGATNVKVTSTNGFAVGAAALIDGEVRTVTAVGTQGRATTLAAAVPAGATNIRVASVQGWNAGDTVVLGSESYTVATVGSAGAEGSGVTLTAPTTAEYANGAAVRMLGTGITLSAPLTSAHAQGAATRGLGTGITVSPALNAADAGATVTTPGTGLALTAGLTKAHASGTAVVGPAPTDWCRPSNGATLSGTCKEIRPVPYLRKAFTVSSEHGAVTKARVYASGLGWNDMTLNGTKTSERTFLDPGFTSYDKTVFYTTDDVTGLVKPGENVLATQLGSGQYDNETTSGNWGWSSAEWRANPTLKADLVITFADGTEQVIKSDETWKTSDAGPIRYDNHYLGETYDARKEISGWSAPGFDASNWADARTVPGPTGKLIAQELERTSLIANHPAGTRSEPRPGVILYDTGQQYAGWATTTVTGAPAGTVIQIRYAEKLGTDGLVSISGYAPAGQIQTDYYISKGPQAQTWTPRFTYKGFQWVQISAVGGTALPDGVNVTVDSVQEIREPLAPTGVFSSSSDLVNLIERNIRSSIAENYVSGVITDTPTYEKNGWAGDAQLSAPIASLQFDTERHFEKSSIDMVDDQRESGEVPLVSPGTKNYGYEGGPAFKPANAAATPIWDAYWFVVPWEGYLRYGDKESLARTYPGMRQYLLNWLTKWFSSDGDQYAYTLSSGLGDWCVPTGADAPLGAGTRFNTPTIIAPSSTAYVAYMAKIAADSARALGKDPAELDALYENVKDDFNAKWWDASVGYYRENGTQPLVQSMQVLPLAFGLVPPERRRALQEKLVYDVLVTREGHQMTGIAGARWIYPVLQEAAEEGVPDAAKAAYTIAQQTTYPSYGRWAVELGWTSLGEYWEQSSRTRNHHMFGSIGQWFYEGLVGMKPTKPAYEQIEFKPLIADDAKLNQASASYESVRGTVASSWKKTAGGLQLNVKVPAGATGRVYVPATDPAKVGEVGSGTPLVASEAPGVDLVGISGSHVVYEVGSGAYAFRTGPGEFAATSVDGRVGGTVPATLALTLDGAATFDPFIPGTARDYTAKTFANVISTAGNATLSVSDPGRMTNGAFTLAEPLRVAFSKSSWTAPVSNEKVDVEFKQLIKANDPLRTGTYSKTLTFTLSTTQP
ncbi:family 78 glycoside hydrolase catalytic domain [Solirubrobacter sp. CPCC 204708]|uniref:alpha-L-rhamnosidase n=1 Tax=Solirubrobacter deserti TaxID=2282478 RepID=A0ABT4RTD5_9ACTN|nr:family 78 glycoside hydrolase catalytic domain [Solirubrobacter deserti]MBE2320745.1 family 78 glycoside hydrolase catalytic domain [Solirubrobacter deserti]MDA0141847.1 family 78 glycoside hydrolase catalytic domain [Solirubrobacter deserti]